MSIRSMLLATSVLALGATSAVAWSSSDVTVHNNMHVNNAASWQSYVIYSIKIGSNPVHTFKPPLPPYYSAIVTGDESGASCFQPVVVTYAGTKGYTTYTWPAAPDHFSVCSHHEIYATTTIGLSPTIVLKSD